MGTVVVVGSVNLDLVASVERLPGPGETVAGGTFARHGGGKGANQAVAAARQGAEVRMLGAVGDDPFAAGALSGLQDAGVDVGAVARLPGEPTGVALIVVDAAGENQIAVASGANARVDGAGIDDLLAAAGAPGVVLLGHEVGDAAVLAGARAAAAAGWTPVLNPAPARPLGDALLELGPLLVPNEAEALALTGAGAVEAAADALRERTRRPVVVTLGAAGALLLSDGGAQRLPAPEVDVLDTTGAGDAFCGALAAALAEGGGVRDAVDAALEAAARSVTVRGARGC